jgi:hypothetical protein
VTDVRKGVCSLLTSAQRPTTPEPTEDHPALHPIGPTFGHQAR